MSAAGRSGCLTQIISLQLAVNVLDALLARPSTRETRQRA